MPKQFVLFCHSRTGGTLFGSLLGSHPQLHWDGEHIYWMQRDRRIPRLAVHVFRRYPLPYIRLRSRWLGKPVYGCKFALFYLPGAEGVLRKLFQENWLVVYLWRRDLFQSVISECMARSYTYYHSFQASRDLPVATYIAPDDFMRSLEFQARLCQRELALLVDMPHLAINYEADLADSATWSTTTARVFAALGLPPATISTPHQKTWRRPYAEMIENYAELVRLFGASTAGDDSVPTSAKQADNHATSQRSASRRSGHV